MHKDQLYPILDSIKLAIETSCKILELPNDPSDYDSTARAESIKSARLTLDVAQRKMRESLGLDFDEIEYKTEDND